MKRLFKILIFLIGPSTIVSAQQEGRIETDRPDQTESPFVTKNKYFQIEAGFILGKDKGFSTAVLPTVLWKYGLLKKFELRLVTEVNLVETPLFIPDGNEINTGLVPIEIGGKLGLFEEKGLIPKTSLLFHTVIPNVGAKKFRASKWAPTIIVSMQNTISETISTGYNFGTEWDGETNVPYWIYTLSSGFNMGKKWYSFIEIFGAARKNEIPQNSIDGGLGYYINENIKLDASGGIGITDTAIDHFFGVGISFRFH